MMAPVQDFLGSARILVVDDHEDSRHLARLVFEHAGYKVSLASTGGEGLERAFLELPDLIVADVVLPEIDGLELVTRLRLHPATCDVRIIALTADARPAVRDDAMRAGCNAFLVKPVQIATLRSVVLEQLLLAHLHGRSRFISL